MKYEEEREKEKTLNEILPDNPVLRVLVLAGILVLAIISLAAWPFIWVFEKLGWDDDSYMDGMFGKS